MSEKRFTEDESYLVNYREYHCIFDRVQGKHLYLSEVIALLNQLDSMNKLLKLKNENLKEMFEQSEERAEHWKSLYETLYEKVE